VQVLVAGNGTGASTVTVSDTLGNTYAQVGSYVNRDNSSNVMSVWYAISIAAGANTVTVAQSNNPAVAGVRKIGLLEYKNVRTSSPLESSASTSAASSTTTVRTTASVTVGGTKRLLIGFFEEFSNLYTPDSGFTQRLGSAGGTTLKAIDKIGAAASAAVTATAVSIPVLQYCAIGASFISGGQRARTSREQVEDKIRSTLARINRLQTLPFLTTRQDAELTAANEFVRELKRTLLEEV